MVHDIYMCVFNPVFMNISWIIGLPLYTVIVRPELVEGLFSVSLKDSQLNDRLCMYYLV